MSEHSPLGASSAERWLNCPGSAALYKRLDTPEPEESAYAKEGSAAHEAAAFCLKTALDSWEVIGQEFSGIVCDAGMAEAVQTYLSFVRPLMTDATVLIESRIGGSPDERPHPDFYGTADFAAVGGGPRAPLWVVDYKHGAGITVEVEENPQLMYYAYGVLLGLKARGIPVDSERPVNIAIVQPRAPHPGGPIRVWETAAGRIETWAETVLLPGMRTAADGGRFEAGEWCRFCPAKLICPLLGAMYEAAAKVSPESVSALTDDRLGREYQAIEAVEHYLKAVKGEVFARLMAGADVPGTKLVRKRAPRVFREGAQEEFLARFGSEAMTVPVLKSVAVLEQLGPDARKLVREWCYVPDVGYTVALAEDRREACRPTIASEVFSRGGESRLTLPDADA